MSRFSSIAYKGIYSPYTSFSPLAVRSITPSAITVNEGSPITFTVNTINAVDNTTLYWTIDNISTANADFPILSNSFIITNNSGSFSITPTADITTEGAETFSVSIHSDSITGTELIKSQTITINDTSVATYSLTSSVASVNEGGSFTITFATNQSGSFPFTIDGITAADIGGTSLTGTVTNGTVLTYNVSADLLTEGTETFTISLDNGLASTSVTINDTSTSLGTTPTLYTSASGANTAAVIDTTSFTAPFGSLVVAIVGWQYNSGFSTITATNCLFNYGGLTFTQRVGVMNATKSQHFHVFYAVQNLTLPSITGTLRAVPSVTGQTPAGANNNGGFCHVMVFTGVNTSNPFVNASASTALRAALYPRVDYTMSAPLNAYTIAALSSNTASTTNNYTATPNTQSNWVLQAAGRGAGAGNVDINSYFMDVFRNTTITTAATYPIYNTGWVTTGNTIVYADQLRPS